ncbi:MAG: pyridoxal phosphate-dependent aminotransferase, partial [Candidatus Binatia bacterium]
YSRYNNKRGVPEYRQAVAEYLQTRGWILPPAQIMATSGAMGGITAALLSHARPGDTVLLPEPFFIGHKLLLKALGFKVHFIPVPLDESPSIHHLQDKMASAKAFILTTPANPTGQVVTPRQLHMISTTATQTDCLVLVDEMYREFIWHENTPDDSPYDQLDLTHTVILRSFSKTYAIPGWRIGFAITSPERIETMATTHDAFYIGGSTIAQHAMARALIERGKELAAYVRELRQELLANKRLLQAAFEAQGFDALDCPAAYYLLLKHERNTDMDAVEALIKENVVTTPLSVLTSTPDSPTGYIRIHFAISPKTRQGVIEALQR